MTFEKFLNNARAYADENQATMRRGQAYFNYLNEVRPDLANKIRGDRYFDPYYNEDPGCFNAFLTWIGTYWSTNDYGI